MIDNNKRLEYLEARQAIEDLVHQYAFNIRSGQGDRCAALFTDDAVFEISRYLEVEGVRETENVLDGRHAITEYLAGSTSGPRLRPVISNLLIEIGGDQATSTSLMSVALPDSTTLQGEYHDSYRCEHGNWKFTKRRYTKFAGV